MIQNDSNEIGKLLSEIPKCQVKEFKGEIEHTKEDLCNSDSATPLTEPNDSPFRVRRLSRSFSIPCSFKATAEVEEEEILLSDENRDSLKTNNNNNNNTDNLGKSKFIVLKRSRSLGNIFLPDANTIGAVGPSAAAKQNQTSGENVENLTEKFEALEIEVLPSENLKEEEKEDDAKEQKTPPIIDRPRTSPPILYPNKRENKTTAAGSGTSSLMDRMQKSLGFLFRCARKDENSSEEEGNGKKLRYPVRSRTPEAKLSQKRIESGPVASNVPMQDINFVTKIDESSKNSAVDISRKIPQFVDIPGPKGPLLPHSGSSKKCLVLDLDETLVHSSFHVPLSHDLVVTLGLPDGTQQNIYVAKRPGVDEFLARVSQVFEVVIFTASLAHYADPVIDFLTVGMNQYLSEPGEINLRLYRDSCLFLRGLYVKDLSRLGRKLEKTVIVDNSPASFLLQPDHGIPIKSWFNDVNDRELALLQESLEHLIEAESVAEWRSIISNLNNVV